MTKTRALRALALAFVSSLATILPLSAAQAYVGPGLSAGAVAVVLGVIGSVFLALFAIVWYPLKRLMKKRKGGPQAAQNSGQNS
jgi:hypothetical protein